MKRLLKKKISFFGKEVSVFVVVLLAVGLVSAALLPFFGMITGTVTVTQGLLVDGKAMPGSESISYSASTTSLENPVITSVHYLSSSADAEVSLTSDCSPANCSEITTKYYRTNLRSGTLELSQKNSDWTQSNVETNITVGYSTDVETGVMTIDNITGLPTSYTLVYYADEEFDTDGNRLATPGQAYFLGTVNGDSLSIKIPISQNDGNLKSDADYCSHAPDLYDHCRGIKLWAIRDADLPSGNTIVWNSGWQSAYYFETDMLGWNHNTEELVNPFDVSSASDLDFVIVSEFPKMMTPDVYTLTTEVTA